MVQVNDQAWHLLSYMMLSLDSHNDTELLPQFIAIDGLVLDVLGSFLALSWLFPGSFLALSWLFLSKVNPPSLIKDDKGTCLLNLHLRYLHPKGRGTDWGWKPQWKMALKMFKHMWI